MTSAYRMVVLGALPMGGLVGGIVASEIGLAAPLWTAAVIMRVMAVGLLPVLTNRALVGARTTRPPFAAGHRANLPRPGQEQVK